MKAVTGKQKSSVFLDELLSSSLNSVHLLLLLLLLNSNNDKKLDLIKKEISMHDHKSFTEACRKGYQKQHTTRIQNDFYILALIQGTAQLGHVPEKYWNVLCTVIAAQQNHFFPVKGNFKSSPSCGIGTLLFKGKMANVLVESPQ